jgi:AraC-like DNA-binding protein
VQEGARQRDNEKIARLHLAGSLEREMVYDTTLMFNVKGPAILPPPPGSVRAGQYLLGFKELVRSRGGDWIRILDANEISASLVGDPDLALDWTSAVGLLDYCSRTLDDDLFGLHLASQQGAQVYSLVAALARSAPTLRQALQSISDFLPFLHSPGAEVELAVGAQTSELRWFPGADFATFEQANHHGLMLAMRLLASVGGGRFQPSYAVSVSQARNREAIERALGCPVHWRARNDAVGFSSQLLDQPLESSNKFVFGLLASYLTQLKEAEGPSLVQQVEAYVAGTVGSGNCMIAGCASRLGLSARTLQKRLTELGTSFSEIVETQRIEAAKDMLRSTRNTLDDIADHLGYAEKSSFCRAFKRATKLTPNMYRSHPGL